MSQTTAQQPTQGKPEGSQTEQKAPLKAEDVIRKVAEVKPAEPKPSEEKSVSSHELLDQINAVQDPSQRKALMDVYKSMEKGTNKKFMELAEKERELNKLREEAGRQQEWTPERVNQLLNDPKFVGSAQMLAQSQAPGNWSGTQDEWSALNNTEKAAFQQLQGQVNSLLVSQNKMQVRQLDEQIKQKYPDYDPAEVDSFGERFDRGEVGMADLRELVHKGLRFQTYLDRALEMGREEGRTLFKEKVNGSSGISSTSVSIGDEKPKMKEGENPREFFKRLGRFNLEAAKKSLGHK